LVIESPEGNAVTVGDHDPADDPTGDWLELRPIAKSRLNDPRVKVRLATPYRVSFDYDIPYVCGISEDNDELYADRTCRIDAAPADLWAPGGSGPLSSRGGKGPIDLTRFIWLHECGEKAFIDFFDDPYDLAHKLITIPEHDAVVEAGINWKRYSKFFEDAAGRTERETLRRVPMKLFMRPYTNEDDWLLISRMQAAMM
jgi:hypothetical protein